MTKSFGEGFRRRAGIVTAPLVALALSVAGLGVAAPAEATGGDREGSCPPSGRAVGYSDALDKAVVDGVTVGGLSSLAYDRRSRTWASTVDNHTVPGQPSDPARIWFISDLRHPRLVGDPLVLRRPDGTAYDGTTADDEGLAVLRDGRFVVSSETEPSIRIFGRDGVQQQSLPVPNRFAVTGTGTGEATANATLEGLTRSPDGRTLVAAMEGALSGDVSASGDATLHRFLVYRAGDRHHRHGWRLAKQVAYRAEPGQRIPEVAAYDHGRLIVEEASYDPATGNAVSLYTVDLRHAVDVSGVADLSTLDLSGAQASAVLHKTLLADVVRCPSLGAVSKQPQANPLLDNYEGMAITGVRRGRPSHHGHRPLQVSLTLISDDNFNPTQITRLLELQVQTSGRSS